MAVPPACSMRCATAGAVAGFLSTTAILAPSCAKRNAMPSPRPCPPPVTIAVLPFRRMVRSLKSWLRKFAQHLFGRPAQGGLFLFRPIARAACLMHRDPAVQPAFALDRREHLRAHTVKL